MNINKTVGKQVRILLWDNGKTQRGLAAHLKVEPATISRKLKGTSPWTLNDLMATCEYLDVPLSAVVQERAFGSVTDQTYGRNRDRRRARVAA